jgi:hypothetical protein
MESGEIFSYEVALSTLNSKLSTRRLKGAF